VTEPRAPVEVSVVVPAFNAAAFIRDTVDELLAYFERAGIDGEVVLSDDGSEDGTSEVVPSHGRVRVIRLARNRGKGAALRAGMLDAVGRVRIFTDADLPYGTAPIGFATGYIRDRGIHAVMGDRNMPGSRYAHAGPLRRAVSWFASLAFRTLITGGISDTQCGFKAFRGDVAHELFRLSRVRGFAIDVELIYLLLKYRLEIKRIPVRLERNAPSSVRVLRDSLRASADIAAMRTRWARGGYASPELERIQAQDAQVDLSELPGVAPGP
jgi:dolichyl-phosphate beta-glucosyltransferase